jgi:hypothetical protein
LAEKRLLSKQSQYGAKNAVPAVLYVHDIGSVIPDDIESDFGGVD